MQPLRGIDSSRRHLRSYDAGDEDDEGDDDNDGNEDDDGDDDNGGDEAGIDAVYVVYNITFYCDEMEYIILPHCWQRWRAALLSIYITYCEVESFNFCEGSIWKEWYIYNFIQYIRAIKHDFHSLIQPWME